MIRRRRSRGGTAMAVAVALSLTAGSAAHAARTNVPAGLDETVTGTHVVVHFTSRSDSPHATTLAAAQTLAANGDRAWDWDVGMVGMPAPLDDGDSRIDIYVVDAATLSRGGSVDVSGSTFTEGRASRRPGYMFIRNTSAEVQRVVTHEMFHLTQYASALNGGTWAYESTAEWAAILQAGLGSRLTWWRSPHVPIDCYSRTQTECSGDGRGYRSWAFWESLAERTGRDVVPAFFARHGDAQMTPESTRAALMAELADRETTIGRAFLDETLQALTGRWTIGGLDRYRPVPTSSLTTGTATGPAGSVDLSIDHLSARYVRVVSPTGAPAPCRAAVLRVRVTAPSGAESAPAIEDAAQPGTAIALARSGDVFEGSLPRWSTCAGRAARLVVQNGSLTADAQPFRVDLVLEVAGSQTPPPTDDGDGSMVDPAQLEPPRILRLTVPRRVVARRSPRVVIVVRSDRAGFADVRVGNMFSVGRRGDIVQRRRRRGEVIGFADVRLRRGLTRVPVDLSGGRLRGPVRVLVLPYASVETEDDVLSERGEAGAGRFLYVNPPKPNSKRRRRPSGRLVRQGAPE